MSTWIVGSRSLAELSFNPAQTALLVTVWSTSSPDTRLPCSILHAILKWDTVMKRRQAFAHILPMHIATSTFPLAHGVSPYNYPSTSSLNMPALHEQPNCWVCGSVSITNLNAFNCRSCRVRPFTSGAQGAVRLDSALCAAESIHIRSRHSFKRPLLNTEFQPCRYLCMEKLKVRRQRVPFHRKPCTSPLFAQTVSLFSLLSFQSCICPQTVQPSVSHFVLSSSFYQSTSALWAATATNSV
jgi:hypothetical protein